MSWNFLLLQLYSLFLLVCPARDFRIWPNFQRVCKRSIAVIYCDSKESVSWTFQGVNLRKLNGATNSLFISPVTEEDRGVYICRGVDKSGQSFLAKSVLTVHNIQVSVNIFNKCFTDISFVQHCWTRTEYSPNNCSAISVACRNSLEG